MTKREQNTQHRDNSVFSLFLSREKQHQSYDLISPPPHLWGIAGTTFHPSQPLVLKALHCGDLLRVIPLLFITVNSTGVYLRNMTTPPLWGNSQVHCPAHYPRYPPPIPVGGRGGGVQWLHMTGA